MNSKLKQSDVWLADVVFKGTRQTKQRPLIIVGNELALEVDIIIHRLPPNNPEINLMLLGVLERGRIIKTIGCSHLKKYFCTWF